jgi:predicted RND superfamily exporter protein
MDAIDRFEWRMRQTEGVHSVLALPGVAKVIASGWNEGSLKWRALSRDPVVLAQSVTPVDTGSGLLNTDCSVMQVMLFMNNHEGATIARVVDEIKKFKLEHDSDKLRFRLASGNVGVMAATNEAVDAAQVGMLASIFGAIIVLCLVTFRSWRGTLCVVIPLGISSVLCQALMALLDIGLKVSTLPVIALGVGIGVDYGIYLYERLQDNLAHGGRSLVEAFHDALRQRGTAVLFTAATMTVGVGSWAFSTLKFQADMGLLLAFMFLANMLGALLLLPALAAYLVRAPRRRLQRG